MFFMTLLLDDCASSAERSRAEQLFTKYNKSVYYMAFSILKSHDPAEDVVQKTFLRVIRNLHKIEDIHSAQTKSFILKIAKNEAIREYNQNKRSDAVSFEDYMVEDGEAVHDTDDIWQTYVEIQDRQTLKEVLQALPEHYRSIILYKYAYGYSYKEISDILGITESNVSVMLTRARKKLIKTYAAANE